jgi:hypothetical protein
MMDDDDRYYRDHSEELANNKPDCNVPEGLMITGIIGALVSVMLTAPVIAIGFVGLWGVGAVAHYNNEGCCAPERLRTD